LTTTSYSFASTKINILMKTIPFLFVFIAVLFFACQEENGSQSGEDPSAEIISQAIEAHGGKAFEKLDWEFQFRDKFYEIKLDSGTYSYVRAFSEEGDSIRDVLTNEGFERLINGEKVQLPDSLTQAYTNSVNSVAYFALLPYPLADPAVKTKYLGKSSLEGIEYDKIEVKFREDGGGEDFQDVFIYWINPNNHTLDYLAYAYDTNGGGLRFRKAWNPRTVNGAKMQDYTNFKADPEKFTVYQMDSLYSAVALEKVSEIDLLPIE
jgi:hypothetical protein